MDLLVIKGTERIAIEVETGKSDVQGNIRKLKEVGFVDVIVVNLKG